MTSAVNSIATIDDESTSNTLKRRRSSSIIQNETDIEQTPSKRVRSSSTTNNSTSDNNNIQSIFSSLNDIVQSHRNLVREYVDLQMHHHPDLSLDEQRFIQTEEDLIEKVEKNLHDTNHIPSTPPSRYGKRQRYQSINSTNQSFDRVKHETHILKRIEELKSDGKWTNQRLAKCLEPNKRKTHWNYLLDEMRWLAEDFLLEKRWKQAMAKKVSLAVLKYFQDKNHQQHEQIKRLRKQAQFTCKEVMNFWRNMHKIVEYKQTTRLEELHKYQLDLNTSSDEDDDEETIELEEQNSPDEYDLNELKELEADRDESIDILLKRHYGIDLSNEKENHFSPSQKESSSESDENDQIISDKQMSDLSITAQSFQPTGFTLNTTSVKTPVPFLLKHSLREYQHVGFDWLVKFYENKLNCILADEIGLGKTIQTIALLSHLACEKGNWGPHLIIVPTNVMFNWEIEFKKWCPALKILTYYGSIKEHQDDFHICITSHKFILQNSKSFHHIKWKYLILDEIKNFKSQHWQILSHIRSQHHLLLTSTSLKNSSIDLSSLMNFLIPSHHECYSNPNDLNPFILRRLKIDVENQMPIKHEHILMCDLSKRQRELYENLIQSKSMELKKVCNHPDLFETRSIISPFVVEKELIKYEIPKFIFDIHFKNPYLSFDYSLNDTFLCFRIKFTLQPTKDMFMKLINQEENNYDDDFNQQKIQLTKDIIERYRNSSLWFQTNQITKNFQNQSEIKQTNVNNQKFQPENIYHEICKHREEDRLSRYEFLFQINSERCQSNPLYGSDTLSQIKLAMRPCHHLNRTAFSGYSLCQDYLTTKNILRRLIKSNKDRLYEYQDILNRFIMCTTRVLASPIELFQSNRIRLTNQQEPLIEVLSSTDFDVLSSINHIKQNMVLQFPERKLIEYDCGKLQILAKLLFDLKRSKHRCLIFTQMTKMLDILELFLNSHNYTYLRFDNITDIFQKQILIERFNNNENIFVCILSTHIGEIDVNLTGADTVIFYDSLWNPIMNAQAQDLCHRIGQIKDVNIYRLINKNTIEENLFKKNNIRGLSTIEDIGHKTNEYDKQLDANRLTMTIDNDLTDIQFEEAFTSVEDEINDFNEKQNSPIEEELNTLDQQLRPIERYALRCVESYRSEYQIPQINPNTYLDAEQIQKDWQLSHLKSLKEQEEKQYQQDDEMMYTYTRDNERKIWVTEDGQTFEIWCGIIMKYSTEENEEIYNDDELDFGYESEAMIIEPEEYIRFPLPKALVDTTNMSKSDTNILVPRSLFDRSNLLLNTQSSSLSTNTLNKSKQISNNNNNNNNKIFPSTISTPQANIKARQLYVNNGTTTTPLPNSSNTNVIVSASTSTSSRPIKLEEMLSKDNFQGLLEIDNSDWLISEDYKVLDTIQNIQQLPLSSMSFSSTSNANKPQPILPNSSLSSSPLLPSTTTTTISSSVVNNTTNALTQNWDFISDIVNRYSRVLRTPKQCKHRFEQVIGPREEGRVVYDLIKKKKHVIKGTVKMSDDNWQMLRTNQLFVHDNCQKLVQIYHQKFETISQFEQQLSSMVYLNKFKQMQIAQATHHQMRGLKQGSLLQENNINVDVPLTPSDVSYQRSEREKELKQQQQAQATQSVAANVHPQQQTPTTPNNIDTIKQQTPSNNTTVASTITSRVRPSSLNTTPTPTPINPSPSTPLSLIPACPPSTPTIQRSVSNNIIVANNNHPTMNPTRSQSNILPSRTNLSSSTPTSINPIPSSSNQPSIPTATILPGQRQVQVLPSNTISTNETNTIQQKQVGTVQISSNDYRHVRTLPHQQQTPTPPPPSTTNPSPTPTNLQVRTQNYQRNQAQAAALATLEVRSQLPPSPKSQQQPSRPPSTTPRTSSVTQSPVDYLIQPQPKSLALSTNQSSLPVAVVRPMQHPSTSVAPTISSSPTSPLNLPSLNVTLPPNKLTTTTTTNNTTNNPTQQLRTATAYLSNQTQSTSQTQQMPQQIRQLFTNANNNSQTTNTQRLTEAAQRSPSSIQSIIAARTSLPGQVRNVRILTFTPGTNPPTGIADTTTTANSQQTPIQSTNLTYNRSNSSTSSFPRSTINIDQDISPDLAAQLHRIKSFSVTNTDPNDTTQTPRAVLVPARTISGSSTSSTSSVGSTSKIKPSSLIDPTTLGFTAKTSQANIVFQLPSSTATTNVGDDQVTTTTNSSGLTRQNLMQHLNLISSNLNQRSQSPNQTTVNRLLQQYQIRAALNSSTSQLSSGQINNEQISSSSPPPPPPPSSSTT